MKKCFIWHAKLVLFINKGEFFLFFFSQIIIILIEREREQIHMTWKWNRNRVKTNENKIKMQTQCEELVFVTGLIILKKNNAISIIKLLNLITDDNKKKFECKVLALKLITNFFLSFMVFKVIFYIALCFFLCSVFSNQIYNNI